MKLAGGTKLTGIAEVFNLFNHANYGAHNGQVNSTTFGQPRQNLVNAYLPRVRQLAFKLSFWGPEVERSVVSSRTRHTGGVHAPERSGSITRAVSSSTARARG